jgi:hypothetical protein
LEGLMSRSIREENSCTVCGRLARGDESAVVDHGSMSKCSHVPDILEKHDRPAETMSVIRNTWQSNVQLCAYAKGSTDAGSEYLTGELERSLYSVIC